MWGGKRSASVNGEIIHSMEDALDLPLVDDHGTGDPKRRPVGFVEPWNGLGELGVFKSVLPRKVGADVAEGPAMA